MIKIYDSHSLGRKIRHYRKQKHFSQSELAKQINMKQTSISDLEMGKINLFSIAKLSLIADILEVTLDDLLCDSINIFKNKTSIHKLKLHDEIDNISDIKILTAFNKITESFIENIEQ